LESVFSRKNTFYFLFSNVIRPFPELEFYASSMAWSKDGKRLMLSSNFGQGSVNQEHNHEIFMIQMPLSDASRIIGPNPERPIPEFKLLPVTDFPYGASEAPDLSRDGRVAVFVSSANFRGGNSDANYEIFMAVERSSSEKEE